MLWIVTFMKIWRSYEQCTSGKAVYTCLCFCESTKRKSRIRTVRTACLANSRHSLCSLRFNYSQDTIPTSNIEEHTVYIKTQKACPLLRLQHRWILRTWCLLLATGRWQQGCRISSICFFFFFFLWSHEGKTNIFQTNKEKWPANSNLSQDLWRLKSAKDSAISSVTSTVYVRMVIQGCCIEVNVAHKVCWPDHLDTQAGMGLQERGSMKSLRKWIRLN